MDNDSPSEFDPIPNSQDDIQFFKLKEESQREIDLLSIELLSNTSKYKKYVHNNRPEERVKRADYMRRFLKYRTRIEELFANLMDAHEDGNGSTTTFLAGDELQNVFKEFVNKSIRHLEWNDLKTRQNNDADDEGNDDDIMFATAATRPAESISNYDQVSSYWGDAIIRKK